MRFRRIWRARLPAESREVYERRSRRCSARLLLRVRLSLGSSAGLGLLLAAVALCPTHSAAGVGRITGVVVDARSGKPIASATVIVLTIRVGTLSGDDGQYLIENVPEGSHAVRATAAGYLPGTVEGISVRAGAETRVRLNLKPEADRVARPDRGGGSAEPIERASRRFAEGQRDSALALIDQMIRENPRDRWSYEQAYQLLESQGAAEEALAVIARGREALEDTALFAGDAADIYRDGGRYDMATREYLKAARSDTDAEVAIAYIVDMAEAPEARATIVPILSRGLGDASMEQTLRACLWQVYLADGDCERALAELALLAARDAAHLSSIPLFAAKSRQRGCYGVCSEAYELAVGATVDRTQIPAYLLEKAKCDEEAGFADRAIATYSQLITEYPKSRSANEGLVALGGLYKTSGRLDEAVAQADKVIASASAGEIRYEGILFKGDCLVLLGRLDDAIAAYDMVGTDWKPAYAQRAFFNLGEVRLFQDSLDEASSYYNVAARQYPDERWANDSLERLLLLRASKSDVGREQLRQFAGAVLARRQGRLDEAASVLRRLGTAGASEAMKVESLKGLAGIFEERQDLESALGVYRLLADSSGSYFSASALEAVGDIYLKTGNTADAVITYEDVILRFPDSVAAGEARRKIDVARRGPGDSPQEPAKDTRLR